MVESSFHHFTCIDFTLADDQVLLPLGRGGAVPFIAGAEKLGHDW